MKIDKINYTHDKWFYRKFYRNTVYSPKKFLLLGERGLWYIVPVDKHNTKYQMSCAYDYITKKNKFIINIELYIAFVYTNIIYVT